MISEYVHHGLYLMHNAIDGVFLPRFSAFLGGLTSFSNAALVFSS